MTVRIVLMACDVRLDVAVPAHLPVLEVRDDLLALAKRAGAALPEQPALVAGGRGALDLGATPHEQQTRHGDLWFVQEVADPVPLRAHHDLAAEAADLVGRGRRSVDAEVRRLGLAGAVGVLGVALAVLSVAGTTAESAPPAWPALTSTSVLVLSLVVLARQRDPATVVAGVALVVTHAAVLGLLAAPWLGIPSAAGGGVVVGMVLASVLLVWMPPGTRESAVLPAVIGVGLGAPVLAAGPALGFDAVGFDVVGAARTCVPVAFGLALGPLATALVDARVVRPHRWPVPGAAPTGKPDGVADGIAGAVRMLVAAEIATVVLAVVATPRLFAEGRWGVLVWLALVSLLLLRARGERLALRAITAWVGAGVLFSVGVIQVATGQLGTTQSAAHVAGVAGVGAPLVWSAVAVACLGCCVALLTGPRAASASRAVVWADWAVRLALPSLWLLSSGLLGSPA